MKDVQNDIPAKTYEDMKLFFLKTSIPRILERKQKKGSVYCENNE